MTLAGNIRREHVLDAAAQPAVGVDRFEPQHPLEQVAAPVGTRVGQEGSELVGYGVVDQAQPGEAGADADLRRSAGIRPQLPGPRRSVVVLVFAGELGDGQDQAHTDHRIVVHRQPAVQD
ncbi:hypothetical protein OG257_00455 [Streptomyces sp. NBC_00683]|uniref:hypothetical protein n=1 Tax=Streptomyces sp. NBC_00683 TaxID=2903670 RepID=UPI002E35AFEA|nr:hypothetical protein [Streptomyces sp. NBC_00683]